jgi:hypothetical protein
MTNRFCAVAALSALLTVGAHALAENGRDYFGVGGESCGSWIDARKANNTSRQGSWLLGYLSALNLWGVIGRKDAGEPLVCGQVRSGLSPGGRWIRTSGSAPAATPLTDHGVKPQATAAGCHFGEILP